MCGSKGQEQLWRSVILQSNENREKSIHPKREGKRERERGALAGRASGRR